MYDPDLGFIRRLEVYKATTFIDAKVYFMIYDTSVEEQKYLTKIRLEQSCFEKLISEKSNMAISLDADGKVSNSLDEMFWDNLDTRSQEVKKTSKILIDVREFRATVPYSLFTANFDIIPITLEVGDYILSPTLCVERKSISDLISSFKSGRLYTQCEAMSAHYKKPILLIEFDPEKNFSLDGTDYLTVSTTGSFLKKQISNFDVQKKLITLSINFPKLCFIWSMSPTATAEIFKDLKRNQDDPDPEFAKKIGVENAETLECEFNPVPQEVLRSMPGITAKNYRLVMIKVSSIRELCGYSLDQCIGLLGDSDGKELFNFFDRVN